MRKTLTALAGAALLASVATAGIACTIPGNADQLRAEMLNHVNAERQRAGLSRLSMSSQLHQAAQRVSCDNAVRNRMSHTTADGSDLRSRLRAAGYRFRSANENLTHRRGGPSAAVQAWMNSGVHRNNLLAQQSREFGGGVALAANGQYFWTMVTGSSR